MCDIDVNGFINMAQKHMLAYSDMITEYAKESGDEICNDSLVQTIKYQPLSWKCQDENKTKQVNQA